MKKVILFLTAFLSSALLFANDIDLFENCPEEAKAVIQQADDLAAQEKYESAFRLLRGAKVSEGQDYILYQKTEYAINYFVQSIMHQAFAFKDFEEGDTFYSTRTATDVTYSIILGDPVSEIENYAEENEMTPILYLALGEYYNDVYGRYYDQWLITPDELIEKSVENYKAAYDSGFYTVYTLSNYGLMLMRQRKTEEAITVYSRLVELDPENPGGLFNLAASYYNAKNYEKAIEVFKVAVLHPEDTQEYQFDAWSYMAECYYLSGDTDGAIKTLEDSKEVMPDYWRPPYTLGLYLLSCRQDLNGSFTEFENAYNMDPTNQDILYHILYTYIQMNLNDYAVDFCETELSKRGEEEYLAKVNLYIYLVQLYGIKAQAGIDYENSLANAKEALSQIKINFDKANVDEADYKQMYDEFQSMIDEL